MNIPNLKQMPVTTLKGVGAKLAGTLSKLGIETLQDLLFHLPNRYADRTRITLLNQLSANKSAVIEGHIEGCHIHFGRRRSMSVTLSDHSGRITLRFFHFTASQKDQFSHDRILRCFGEARPGPTGLEIYHPEYEFIDTSSGTLGHSKTMDDRLTPLYALTEGLTQTRLRSLIQQALVYLNANTVEELIPSHMLQKVSDIPLEDALHFLHAPPKTAAIDQLIDGVHPHQKRLAFEELLAHSLTVQKSRIRAREEQSASLSARPMLIKQMLGQLPFSPTAAQQRVTQEIQRDMQRNFPMMRLVQGDVGSGKTLVAALAAIVAIGNGLQVGLIAPTEILAEQHYITFTRWFEVLNIRVGWLIGKLTAAQKRKAYAEISTGDIQMVVGTHALFQESVQFAQLGLIIVDEQHRFGVHQRLALRNKGRDYCPHQLVMTATPIPRTLAMSVYADLDVSVIDELPPGRKAINTVAISQTKRDQVIERVQNACSSGQQSYWVCTLIEDSETLSASAAEVTFAELQTAMPELKTGLIHGRMKPAEKEQVMLAFKTGELQLLVATTVIEVGVDVPNASLVIIENPERLGLAQLHQLRGRVGRGSVESHCVLLYANPLSRIGRERLQVLRDSNDGFVIAEKDMALRGPGELLGTAQTGDLQFRTADLMRDQDLIEHVRTCAYEILEQQPERAQKIIMRWYNREQAYVNV